LPVFGQKPGGFKLPLAWQFTQVEATCSFDKAGAETIDN